MKPFISRTEKTPFKAPGLRRHLPGQIVRETPLSKSVAYMKSLQRTDGYWWFALEANETIGAEFIFLMNYLGAVDEEIQKAIARRILDVQRPDGTWAIYNDGPGCISTTLECYLALKIAGLSVDDPRMARAREFILSCGGAEKVRVFTKIHLAMFGLVPWEATPAMPVEYILMPHWAGCSIYEFSSWARATIVPLLIFMSFKKVQKLKDGLDIEELFCNPSEKRTWRFKTTKGLVSWENFFINLDKCLRVYGKFPLKPLRKLAISKCSEWTLEHVKKTEDIYPALAYGALAFKAMGYSLDSPEIRKPFEALRMFHQCYTTKDLAALPDEVRDDGRTRPSELRELGISPRIASGTPRMAGSELRIHQQCCISPVWDTPWMVISLLEAGCPASDPALLRAGRWLMRKQITDVRGDWAVKNPGGKPGGWSFEFENDYFPDVDDTIEVLTVLDRLDRKSVV